jgi:hypothetical protein
MNAAGGCAAAATVDETGTLQREQRRACDKGVQVAWVGAAAAATAMVRGGGRGRGGGWKRVSASGDMITGVDGGSKLSWLVYLKGRLDSEEEG